MPEPQGFGYAGNLCLAEAMEIAGHWFDIEQLDDSLFRVSEPHVVSFMRANMFMVKGSTHCLLVDAGNGVVPLRPFLQAHGLDPGIIIASHAHADHIGGLHEWPLVLAHSAEAEGLARLDPGVTLAGQDYNILDIATLMTGDASLKGPMITALPHAGYTARDYRLIAPHVQPIEDGYRIDLGNRSFEALHVPGHCPGQLAFWDAENSVLLGCDAIYDDEPLDTLHHSSRSDYRRSLSRLLALRPNLTHGGHGGPMILARLHEVIETYLAATASLA